MPQPSKALRAYLGLYRGICNFTFYSAMLSVRTELFVRNMNM